MKLCFCNNLLLAKLHLHPPLPASFFQHCCLFSSLLKYFPSLVSVTAFFFWFPSSFPSFHQTTTFLRFQIFVSLSEVFLPYFYTFYQHLKIYTSQSCLNFVEISFSPDQKKAMTSLPFKVIAQLKHISEKIIFLAFHQLNLSSVLFQLILFD